ncbi:MAG TPA: AgmX/PglI C-terminal domain-containing protein [Myxococcales bacterium]|nr:AgmX/PglI C-terminal domain-containing protein [Myxococcales bacterium]
MITLLLLLAQAPAAKPPPPKASMEIVFEATDDEPPPPIPQGDERKAIGDYIRDNSGDVRDCYAKRLQDRPTLQGKLVARFDIGPSGKVIGASADGIADKELRVCVVNAVRKWEFEKPQSGGKLRVAYPFKFEPTPSR